MLLKSIIILLLIAVVISLFMSFSFLMKDQGRKTRNITALKIRVGLAFLLMCVVFYGIVTGQLRDQSPWGQRLSSPATNQPPTTNQK